MYKKTANLLKGWRFFNFTHKRDFLCLSGVKKANSSVEDETNSKKRKRSPKSFPKESYFESIRCLRISSVGRSIQKFGDHSDCRKCSVIGATAPIIIYHSNTISISFYLRIPTVTISQGPTCKDTLPFAELAIG